MPSALTEHSAHPLNAETRLQDLTQHLITPNDLLFHRNHEELPTDLELHVPLADKLNEEQANTSHKTDGFVLSSTKNAELPSAWRGWPIEFSIESSLDSHVTTGGVQLASLDASDVLVVKMTLGQVFGVDPGPTNFTVPPPSVMLATIECAGNRRSEMNKRGQWGSTEGIEWGGGVIGCGVWQGVKLRDLLLGVGLKDPFEGMEEQQQSAGEHSALKAAFWAQDLHLHFISREPSGRPLPSPQVEAYGASLPLTLAMHPSSAIHLAHSLNGIPLSIAHGAPLRAMIPGHLGARWVKWLVGLRVATSANESEPMLLDYKIMSPQDEQTKQKLMGDADHKGKDEAYREKLLRGLDPLMRLPLGSEIALPEAGQQAEVIEEGGIRTFHSSGYAVGQEGSLIQRVEYTLLTSPSTNPEKVRDLAAQQPPSAWKPACVRRPRLEELDGGGWKVHEETVSGNDRPKSDNGNGYAWALWNAQVELPSKLVDEQKLHLVIRAGGSQL